MGIDRYHNVFVTLNYSGVNNECRPSGCSITVTLKCLDSRYLTALGSSPAPVTREKNQNLVPGAHVVFLGDHPFWPRPLIG